MWLSTMTPIFITIIGFTQQFQNKSELIFLTLDFMQLQNAPRAISAFLCWNKEDSLQFFKKMSSMYRIALIKQIKFIYFDRHEYQIFVVDLDCPEALKLLHLAEEVQLFKNPYKWLLFDKNNKNWSEFYFGVNSQVYIIRKFKARYAISIFYKFTPNCTEFEEIVLGSTVSDKITALHPYSPLNRTNLKGNILRISYVVRNLESLDDLWDYRHTHIDALSKFNYILTHHLIDYLNCTKELILRNSWGYEDPTGFYGGMVGDLQSGFAELGGTCLFYTEDRLNVVDFLPFSTPIEKKFIFKAPSLSNVKNVFILPFNKNIWHFSFILIFIISLCIYCINLWEWRDPIFREIMGNSLNILRPNFLDVVMLNIGAISQQGTDVEPKSISGRIATIFTFLALMFMYTFYSANIVVLLQSTTDSVATFEDLLNSRMELGMQEMSQFSLENNEDSIQQEIYQKMIASKIQKHNFMNTEEGIGRVRKGFFAFHTDLTSGYKIVSDTFQEDEKCGLREISYISLAYPSIPSRKNSEYKKIIKLGKIAEAGLQQRESSKFYLKKIVCEGKQNNFISVGLVDCYTVFLIFATGFLVSINILILERLTVERYRNYISGMLRNLHFK